MVQSKSLSILWERMGQGVDQNHVTDDGRHSWKWSAANREIGHAAFWRLLGLLLWYPNILKSPQFIHISKY